jgi:lipopolysaccharide exporter
MGAGEGRLGQQGATHCKKCVAPSTILPMLGLLNRLSQPGATIAQKVGRGGAWSLALRVLTRLLRLLQTVVLARLLLPADFGLVGVGLLLVATLETLTQPGFAEALIQKEGDVEPCLDTAWTAGLIRAGLLGSILFFSAPLAVGFFGEPRVAPILRVLALSFALRGCANVGVVLFRRDLFLFRQFLYEAGGIIAELATAVTLAWLLRNAWALVGGFLAHDLVCLILSYVLHPYRPSLRLEVARARELGRFGVWMFAAGVIYFLNNQGDDWLVGRLLGIAALGLYQLAYKISNAPVTEIVQVISQVTFPAYSRLQRDLPALRRVHLRTLSLVLFIMVPIVVGVVLMVGSFTRIFLGERWLPIVPVAQILVGEFFLKGFSAANTPVLHALGRPDLSSKIGVFKFILMAVLIYPLTVRWGIVGTALAVVVSDAIVNPLTYYLLLVRWLGIDARALNRSLVLPVVSGGAMGAVLLLGRAALGTGTVGTFLIVGGGGLLAYAVVAVLLDWCVGHRIARSAYQLIRAL